MKNFAARLFAVALLSVATLGNVTFAGGGGSATKVALIQHKGDVVALHFQKAEKEAITVRITNDRTKKVVFSDSDKKHQAAVKKYDLSNLPTGTYTVKVNAGGKVYVQTVTL